MTIERETTNRRKVEGRDMDAAGRALLFETQQNGGVLR